MARCAAPFPRLRSRRSKRPSRPASGTIGGQLCVAIEASLPPHRAFGALSPRERALEVFGLLRVWDTEENAGVLVYVLLADRDVEIIADRSIHRLRRRRLLAGALRDHGSRRRDGRCRRRAARRSRRSATCSRSTIRATRRAATRFRTGRSLL